MDYSIIFNNGFAVCRFEYLSGSFIVKSPAGGIVKISKESFLSLNTVTTRVTSNIFMNWGGNKMKKFRQDYRKEIVIGVRPDEMKRYAEHGELIELEELEKLKQEEGEVVRELVIASKVSNPNINKKNLQYFLGSNRIKQRHKYAFCNRYVREHCGCTGKRYSWVELIDMISKQWDHFKKEVRKEKARIRSKENG